MCVPLAGVEILKSVGWIWDLHKLRKYFSWVQGSKESRGIDKSDLVWNFSNGQGKLGFRNFPNYDRGNPTIWRSWVQTVEGEVGIWNFVQISIWVIQRFGNPKSKQVRGNRDLKLVQISIWGNSTVWKSWAQTGRGNLGFETCPNLNLGNPTVWKSWVQTGRGKLVNLGNANQFGNTESKRSRGNWSIWEMRTSLEILSPNKTGKIGIWNSPKSKLGNQTWFGNSSKRLGKNWDFTLVKSQLGNQTQLGNSSKRSGKNWDLELVKSQLGNQTQFGNSSKQSRKNWDLTLVRSQMGNQTRFGKSSKRSGRNLDLTLCRITIG